MRTARQLAIVLTWLVSAVVSQAAPDSDSQSTDAAAAVMPIDWSRLDKPVALGKDYQDCLWLLETSARYNLGWIPQQFRENPALASYPLTQFDEHGVRPACSVVYGMAVLLKSQGFDQNVVGLSRPAALERTVKLLRGIVATHKSNTGGAPGWGDHLPHVHDVPLGIASVPGAGRNRLSGKRSGRLLSPRLRLEHDRRVELLPERRLGEGSGVGPGAAAQGIVLDRPAGRQDAPIAGAAPRRPDVRRG